MPSKICPVCGETKDVSEFYSRIKNEKIHYERQCKKCKIAYQTTPARRKAATERARNRTTAQRQEERRRIKERKGQVYRTAEELKLYRAKKSKTHKESEMNKLAEINAKQAWRYWIRTKAPDKWMRQYYDALGRPWSNSRLSSGQKYKMRYRLDAEFQLKERMRRQLKKAERRDGVAELIRGALHRNGESQRVKELLGYSVAELKEHQNDRVVDNWMSLFTIADLAGSDWRDKADKAFTLLNATPNDEAPSVMLLEDIRDIFSNCTCKAMRSKDLVEELNALEDRPWCEWKHGKPMTAISLARLLKPFGIHPSSHRYPGSVSTAKGYMESDFKDAFKRYLPLPANQTGTLEQSF